MVRIISFDIGIRNLAYSIISWDEKSKQWDDLKIEEWRHIDILEDSKQKNSKKIPIEKCIQMIFKILESTPSFKDTPIDRIIIERQVKRSPRNLMASIAIMSFFMLKMPNTSVDFISSSSKLKINIECSAFVFTSTTPSIQHHVNDTKLSASKNKTLRKKKAVELCNIILKNNPQLQHWEEFFTKQSKKDDLSDCLLQVIYYLQSKYTHKNRKRKTYNE